MQEKECNQCANKIAFFQRAMYYKYGCTLLVLLAYPYTYIKICILYKRSATARGVQQHHRHHRHHSCKVFENPEKSARYAKPLSNIAILILPCMQLAHLIFYNNL